mmetsp:Transcript_464/g.597  ORF Transcript_464/g.597 Transcript_464/m.597 type:complete len:162 (-) Transcript_464:513-998(-)
MLVRVFSILLILPSVVGFIVTPTGLLGSSRVSKNEFSTVVMATGSQVPFRIRRKRLENQSRGRMRLNIYRSNNHIYAQIIDDIEGNTLLSCSTLDPVIKDSIEKTNDVAAAAAVGKLLGERIKEKGIDALYFDRFSGSNKYMYHGRVKALVDAVRDQDITV